MRKVTTVWPALVLALVSVTCASDRQLSPGPLPDPLEPLDLPESSSARAQTRAKTKTTDGSEGQEPLGDLGETGPLREPTSLELTVEEAGLMALHHNPDMLVQQLVPQVREALAQVARGRYDPELFARAQLEHERSVETARATEDSFDVEGTGSTAVLGIRQNAPTGTTVEATVAHDFAESSRTPPQQRTRLGLSVTQALLQGLSPAVNLASIEQADLGVQASRYELRAYVQAMLAEVEQTYWRHVLATRAIAIYEESLAVALQQRDAIEQEVQVGTLAPTEAAAVRAEVAVREQDLIDARSALDASCLRLKRMLGADLERPLFTSSDPAITTRPITNIDERLQLAEQSRDELNEALLRLEQRRLDTVMTRNGLLPRLDLFVALGKTGYGDNFPSAVVDLPRDTYDLRGGLSFNYLLLNQAARGSHRAATVSYQQAEIAVDNLRQAVELEVRLAINEAERARQQILASTATRSLQEDKVAAENERFHVGEGTALSLAQAQRDLLESRIAEVRALVDYRNALVDLYRAEGSLLQRRGLLVRDARSAK